MMVVLFHLGGAVAADKYFGLPGFSVPFSFGDAGVEFFFVLSGFIILYAHRNDLSKPSRLASYAAKRFVRIYPIYWIVFLAVAGLAAVSSVSAETLPHDFSLIVKALLLMPLDKAVVGGTGAPVIIVAWTLQYEILFYSFFTFLVISRLLGATLLVLAFCIYLYSMMSGSALQFPLSFIISDYSMLFVLGMAVARLCIGRTEPDRYAGIYLVIGVCVFGLVALSKILGTGALSAWKTILYGISFSMLVYGLVQKEFGGVGYLRAGWLQTLGDSSYVLYLIHYPLISVLCKAAMLADLKTFGMAGALMAFLSSFIICLAVSVLVHAWVEKPVIVFFRKRILPRVPGLQGR